MQQDDILVETMTPRSSLDFAAKLRTNLTDFERKEKVDLILHRLGLSGCQNTLIGGIAVKGLSGGERKRTSIGYELITEPNLMLLDEPTSGLDSSTALRIIQLMRKEASRGMSVICTIHQPSSQILQEFDRVILLSEGHTVF